MEHEIWFFIVRQKEIEYTMATTENARDNNSKNTR